MHHNHLISCCVCLWNDLNSIGRFWVGKTTQINSYHTALIYLWENNVVKHICFEDWFNLKLNFSGDVLMLKLDFVRTDVTDLDSGSLWIVYIYIAIAIANSILNTVLLSPPLPLCASVYECWPLAFFKVLVSYIILWIVKLRKESVVGDII